MSGQDRDQRWEGERAELERVLASRGFSRAPALSRILAYVCEKHFQGESKSIKEYNIAVDALGRPPHFNSSADTIVRVAASRLRKRLREYYDDEGAGHPIQILLPESGYQPQFVTRPEAKTPNGGESLSAPPEAPGPAPRKSRSRMRFAGGAILLAGILLFTLSRGVFQPGRKSGPSSVAALGSAPAQPAPSIEPGVAENGIRILAGFNGPKFIDSQGRVWLSDRYYSGGSAVVRRFRRIYRTRSQELYRTARAGDFQYDIPLKPGVYELRLHFVESVSEETDLDSGGEQTSRFHIFFNGKMLIRAFDIVADAFGPNIADERVFTDISPGADGQVHLRFASFMNKAHLTAIEILPGIPGKMRPVRIVAAPDPVIDAQGNLWSSDLYSLGGKITRRGSEVENTPDPALYSSERWGHFNYAIPAAPGSYRVTLRFAETYPAPFRIGERVFDVYCNGVALLKNFDVFAEAGSSNRAWDKTFTGLRPNAQGKLVLSFVPVLNYAIVNAIEVTPE
jgi:hypothetical protein